MSNIEGAEVLRALVGALWPRGTRRHRQFAPHEPSVTPAYDVSAEAGSWNTGRSHSDPPAVWAPTRRGTGGIWVARRKKATGTTTPPVQRARSGTCSLAL